MITNRTRRGVWLLSMLLTVVAGSLAGAGPARAATPPGPVGAAATTQTAVAIRGAQFLINGQPPAPATVAAGLLLNSRMIQGIFDDENPATVGNWAYPDTGRWDAQRNTDELVAAIPSYAQRGLRLITVGLQGGCPRCDSSNGQNVTTAFNPDGSLKPAWLARLDQVLRAADANGIVVQVSLFYYKQDYRLSSQAAVQAGINNITDWLVAGGYSNVLVEVANECNLGGFYPNLACGGEAQTIAQVQQRSGGRLKVSVSYTGGAIPDAAVVTQADFVTLHGNGQGASGVANMVAQVKAMPAYQAHPKPIIFNEDSTSTANLDAAVQAGASWGYYDQGQNNYQDGFQSPPVNWAINTASKQAFFSDVQRLTGSSTLATPIATPTATAPAPAGGPTATPTATATATPTATATATATPTVTAATTGGAAVRVNAGGGVYTDAAGNTWAADAGYSGGTEYATGAAIAGTTDQPLYRTERYGTFSYSFAVPNGSYTVILKFAELYWTQPGQRVFNVAINGQSVLTNFDILAQVPPNTALDKAFPASVTNGTLAIAFTTVKDNAKVSAIQVVSSGGAGQPGPTATPTATATSAPTATRTTVPTPTATPATDCDNCR